MKLARQFLSDGRRQGTEIEYSLMEGSLEYASMNGGVWK
jgi:hypothetical protein